MAASVACLSVAAVGLAVAWNRRRSHHRTVRTADRALDAQVAASRSAPPPPPDSVWHAAFTAPESVAGRGGAASPPNGAPRYRPSRAAGHARPSRYVPRRKQTPIRFGEDHAPGRPWTAATHGPAEGFVVDQPQVGDRSDPARGPFTLRPTEAFDAASASVFEQRLATWTEQLEAQRWRRPFVGLARRR